MNVDFGPKPTKYYIIFNSMIIKLTCKFNKKTNTYSLMPSKFDFNFIIKKILNIEKKYLHPYFRLKVYILAHHKLFFVFTYILYHMALDIYIQFKHFLKDYMCPQLMHKYIGDSLYLTSGNLT
jgi:hypothetical protein